MAEHAQHTAKKVLAIIEGMKADHVRAQQPFEQFAPPLLRQQPENLVVGKRDMQKETDGQLR